MAEQCDLVKPEKGSKQTAYFIGSLHFISTGSIRQLRLSLPGKATLENHLAIAIQLTDGHLSGSVSGTLG